MEVCINCHPTRVTHAFFIGLRAEPAPCFPCESVAKKTAASVAVQRVVSAGDVGHAVLFPPSTLNPA